MKKLTQDRNGNWICQDEFFRFTAWMPPHIPRRYIAGGGSNAKAKALGLTKRGGLIYEPPGEIGQRILPFGNSAYIERITP